MSSIQYTIRSIPKSVDKVLRDNAKKSGKSFNATIVEALERATGVVSTDQQFTDLDHIFGKGIADSRAFEDAVSWEKDLPVETDITI